MRRNVRWILIVAGIAVIFLIAAAIVFLSLYGGAMLNSLLRMYPSAPAMPPVVSVTVEELLTSHESFLETNAPAVFTALQPGLSDSEIDRLEAAHSIKLTGDLRALYNWRNGIPRSVSTDAFPNHAFVPLEEALAQRDILREQVKAQSAVQRQFYAAFAGHSQDWVGLIQDGMGGGYFFDPGRSEPQGSFFFCFPEDGYIFYPAFRNYLAAVVEGEKTGVFVVGPLGIETADFDEAQALWLRFGATPHY